MEMVLKSTVSKLVLFYHTLCVLPFLQNALCLFFVCWLAGLLCERDANWSYLGRDNAN